MRGIYNHEIDSFDLVSYREHSIIKTKTAVLVLTKDSVLLYTGLKGTAEYIYCLTSLEGENSK